MSNQNYCLIELIYLLLSCWIDQDNMGCLFALEVLSNERNSAGKGKIMFNALLDPGWLQIICLGESSLITQ